MEEAVESEANNSENKPRYPKVIFFIIVNEFCERFSFYGMRAVLSLYLRNYLKLREENAKMIYHIFLALCYTTPLLGGILSDSWLGKFKTILYLSILYALGNVVLSMSATKPIGLPEHGFTYLGLFLIAVGTGGIKPCVSSFGGDQFVLPEQDKQLAAFFSMFYWIVNAGSFLSTFITPLLREKVHCFGDANCFPLAFGVPGILMLIAVIIFVAGYRFYKHVKPQGNMFIKVSKCIGHGIKKKCISCKTKEKVDHWMDRAEPKYGIELVHDVKTVLRVLLVLTPIPVFWALFDQQGSGWTFQASRMRGRLGDSVAILPDQMQLVNPLLILLFIPLFAYGVYPLLGKMHMLRKPLSRIVCGGFLTAASFGMSACVSFAVEATYPVLPSAGNAQVRMYNLLDCNIVLQAKPYIKPVRILPMNWGKLDIGKVKGRVTVNYTISGCAQVANETKEGTLFIKEKSAMLMYLNRQRFQCMQDDIQKETTGYPKIRTLVNDVSWNAPLTYSGVGDIQLTVRPKDTSIKSIYPGTYSINGFHKKLQLELGGVYTVLVALNNKTIKSVQLLTTTRANSVHILWQVPQYVVITAGEVMVSVTGLEFSYSQAPISMKAFVTSCWLMTNAMGNTMVVVIEAAKLFEKQSYNFLLYTFLMVLDMVGFFFLTLRYKYSQTSRLPTRMETLDSME